MRNKLDVYHTHNTVHYDEMKIFCELKDLDRGYLTSTIVLPSHIKMTRDWGYRRASSCAQHTPATPPPMTTRLKQSFIVVINHGAQ